MLGVTFGPAPLPLVGSVGPMLALPPEVLSEKQPASASDAAAASRTRKVLMIRS